MREVLYTCPFVPAEWIAAHGFRPRGILPPSRAASQAGSIMGVCAFADAFLEMTNAATDTIIVFTSRCDQMRRAWDCARQRDGRTLFLLNLPATWQTPAARQLYQEELERLGRFFVRFGGCAPADSDLRAIMARYESARQTLRTARPGFAGRPFAEAILRFHQDGTAALPTSTAFPPTRVPVALVGGPLLAGHFEVFDCIEHHGGQVVLNATLHGERSLVEPPAPNQSPRIALADAYFQLPDVFQRPNTRLYEWLRARLSARNVKGILTWHYSWCDLWRVEIQRLREKLRLPVLELDTGDSATVTPAMQNRIQAFLEMLAA